MTKAALKAVFIGCCLMACPSRAISQAWTPMQGYGAVTMGVQYTRVSQHLFSLDLSGFYDPASTYSGGPGNRAYLGDIVGETALLSADYGVLRNLAVSAQVAYVTSRYKGLDPESPLDDGHFHGRFQDISVGVRYRVSVFDFAVTPLVSYHAPLTDYPTMGHSAIGLGFHQTDLGVAVGRTLGPVLPSVAVEAAYSHSFVHPVSGYDLDRNSIEADAAWFASKNVTLGGRFSFYEVVGGLDWYWDTSTMEGFMNHDVTAHAIARHAGVDIDYRLGPAFSVSADYEWTLSGSNSHAIQGLTLAVSRSFSTHKRGASGS
jgi:hypothetical protein